MDEEEIEQFDENDEMFSDLSTLDQELNDDLITDSVCDTEPRINPCFQRWQHHFNEKIQKKIQKILFKAQLPSVL